MRCAGLVAAIACACGRIGFDGVGSDVGNPDALIVEVCVVGMPCEVTGSCFEGTTVCGEAPGCLATRTFEAGAPCTAGSCDDAGVCTGTRGTIHRATGTSVQTGFSVAIDGTRAVAGAWAPRGLSLAGQAVVFERDGAGWVEVARLVPSDSANNDGFGSAVAIQGDLIMVGARRRLPDYQGAVYVFERNGDVWSEKDIIVVPGVINLGSAIAIDGDRAVATAHLGMLDGGYGSGHVLERDLVTRRWSVVAALTSPNADSLGWSADLQGDRVVLGSLWTPDSTGNGIGAAHVYERQANGTWSEVATLHPPATALGTHYAAGSSVMLDGDRLAVGDQMFYSPAANRDQGAIVIWERDEGGTWNPTSTLIEKAPLRDAGLGRSLVLHGDRLVTTSVDYVACQVQISVFRRQPDNTWLQTARVVPDVGCNADESVEGMITDLDVVISGEQALVGYPIADGLYGNGAILSIDLTGL